MSSGPESQSVQSNRRSFLAGLLAAGSAAVGALLAFPLVRFTWHPVLARTTEKSWSDVGSVDEFQNIDAPIKKLVTIEQRDGWRKTVTEKPVYVSKDSKGELIVLSAVCTHLGCTVPWVEKEKKFICPCHLGVLRLTGNYSGDLRLATWTAWKPKSKMECSRRSTSSSASSLAIRRSSPDADQRSEVWVPQMAGSQNWTRLASASRARRANSGRRKNRVRVWIRAALSVPLTDCHRGFLGDVLRAISGPRPHHGRVHHKRSDRRLVLAEHSRLRIERNHHRAAASSDADFSLWILQRPS